MFRLILCCFVYSWATAMITASPNAGNGFQDSSMRCYELFHSYIAPFTGNNTDQVMRVYSKLSPQEKKQYLSHFTEMGTAQVNFNLFQPFETIAWLQGRLTPQSLREKQHAELFTFILDSSRVNQLLKKAFTPGQHLSKLEARALIFLVEHNFWYQVQWRTMTLTGLLAKAIPIGKWIRIFNFSQHAPFSQMYIQGHMTLRSIFGPSALKIRTFTHLADLLKRLPNKETVLEKIDEQLAAIEKERDPSYISEQRLLNLQFLKKSLLFDQSDRKKLEKDIQTILADQSGTYPKALLLETFPHLLRFPARLNDKIVMWMWSLSLITAVTTTVLDFFWPETDFDDPFVTPGKATVSPPPNQDPADLDAVEKQLQKIIKNKSLAIDRRFLKPQLEQP